MTGLAFLPWYPRDFRSTTLTWPLAARAIYRELLDAQWDSGGLPASEKELASIVRAEAKDWRAAWPLVGEKFPIGADGLRRNARLEQHRKKSLKLLTAHRAGAIKTNAKRWGLVSLSDSQSDTQTDSLSVSPPSPSPSPSPESEEEASQAEKASRDRDVVDVRDREKPAARRSKLNGRARPRQ